MFIGKIEVGLGGGLCGHVMWNILETILKEYQAMILEDICRRYGLDRDTMFRKYHTPSFYQPYVVPKEKQVCYIQKGHKEKAEEKKKK